MQLSCLRLDAFAYSEAFYLHLCVGAFLITIAASLLTTRAFFVYNWSFLAYSGKVLLIRTSTDCKQRSSTVSTRAPTVSKNVSPLLRICMVLLHRMVSQILHLFPVALHTYYERPHSNGGITQVQRAVVSHLEPQVETEIS